MTEPRKVTLYTVIEKEVLLETPLTPNGYWVSYGHDLIPSLIKDWVGPQDESGPLEDLGVFYTMMQAHHVVNQFGEDMFVSFDPKVEEIFRVCEAAKRREELDKRDRDVDRLKGIIEKLEMANQNIRTETEERFKGDIECLRAANRELKTANAELEVSAMERRIIAADQDALCHTGPMLLQNAFVYSPLWRRLWIALFPAKLYSLPIE